MTAYRMDSRSAGEHHIMKILSNLELNNKRMTDIKERLRKEIIAKINNRDSNGYFYVTLDDDWWTFKLFSKNLFTPDGRAILTEVMNEICQENKIQCRFIRIYSPECYGLAKYECYGLAKYQYLGP